jgi:hypothetical protein
MPHKKSHKSARPDVVGERVVIVRPRQKKRIARIALIGVVGGLLLFALAWFEMTGHTPIFKPVTPAPAPLIAPTSTTNPATLPPTTSFTISSTQVSGAIDGIGPAPVGAEYVTIHALFQRGRDTVGTALDPIIVLVDGSRTYYFPPPGGPSFQMPGQIPNNFMATLIFQVPLGSKSGTLLISPGSNLPDGSPMPSVQANW